MKPGLPSAPATFLRRVWKILDAAEHGLQWGDNLGQTVTFDVVKDKLPIDVKTNFVNEPQSVRLLKVVLPSSKLQSNRRLWGGNIEGIWLGDGTLRLTKIDCLNQTDATYRVTIGLYRGD